MSMDWSRSMAFLIGVYFFKPSNFYQKKVFCERNFIFKPENVIFLLHLLQVHHCQRWNRDTCFETETRRNFGVARSRQDETLE